jgi:2-dehydro-3-deoxygluconokinase
LESETFRKDIGGADVTVAATAARLGSKVQFVSAVASDPFQAFIRERLAAQNIDISYVNTCNNCYNGLYFTSSQYPEHRDYLIHHTGTASQHIVPALIYDDRIESCKIVYASSELQSVSRQTRHSIFKAFHLAHSKNIMVAYDPNLRLTRWTLDEAREGLWSVLSLLDVIFLSAPQESKALFGYERPLDVIGFLWDRGVSTVVVKTGAGGCMVGYDGKLQAFQQPDTHGLNKFKTPTLVGSAFNGGFLHAIACGLDPFEAAVLANSVALYKGIKGEGIDSLPTAEDLRV